MAGGVPLRLWILHKSDYEGYLVVSDYYHDKYDLITKSS